VTLPDVIDLLHLGQPRALAAYLIPGPEPALIDCGPASCLPALERGLADRGLSLSDLRHVFLTHIHLDHAGAAGALVAANPSLQVHVSSVGAPHLLDPGRLEHSALRLFGSDFDRLWGRITRVPAANLRVLGTRELGFECFATPGHAIHHVSFLDRQGNCFTGDVTGVRIAPSRYVAPATPPPDIDLPAYARSLAAIEARQPDRLCLSHFGIFEDVRGHLARMRSGLVRWSDWVRDGATEHEFVAAARRELDPAVADTIETTAPFEPSYAGLKRYWATERRSFERRAS
jgi:glyoxylase-like metal-dependent hydrolase (beta-lactamase superfamily II)